MKETSYPHFRHEMNCHRHIDGEEFIRGLMYLKRNWEKLNHAKKVPPAPHQSPNNISPRLSAHAHPSFPATEYESLEREVQIESIPPLTLATDSLLRTIVRKGNVISLPSISTAVPSKPRRQLEFPNTTHDVSSVEPPAFQPSSPRQPAQPGIAKFRGAVSPRKKLGVLSHSDHLTSIHQEVDGAAVESMVLNQIQATTGTAVQYTIDDIKAAAKRRSSEFRFNARGQDGVSPRLPPVSARLERAKKNREESVQEREIRLKTRTQESRRQRIQWRQSQKLLQERWLLLTIQFRYLAGLCEAWKEKKRKRLYFERLSVASLVIQRCYRRHVARTIIMRMAKRNLIGPFRSLLARWVHKHRKKQISLIIRFLTQTSVIGAAKRTILKYYHTACRIQRILRRFLLVLRRQRRAIRELWEKVDEPRLKEVRQQQFLEECEYVAQLNAQIKAENTWRSQRKIEPLPFQEMPHKDQFFAQHVGVPEAIIQQIIAEDLRERRAAHFRSRVDQGAFHYLPSVFHLKLLIHKAIMRAEVEAREAGEWVTSATAEALQRLESEQ